MKNYTFEHIDTKRWGIGNYPAGNDEGGDGGDIMVDAGAYVLSTSDYGDTWTEIGTADGAATSPALRTART